MPRIFSHSAEILLGERCGYCTPAKKFVLSDGTKLEVFEKGILTDFSSFGSRKGHQRCDHSLASRQENDSQVFFGYQAIIQV